MNDSPQKKPDSARSQDETIDAPSSGSIGEARNPKVPNSIERFAILRPLGHGGMGDVFLARHPVTGSEVALKRLRPSLVGDPQSMHRFLVEARHMYHLNHPSILRIMEVLDPPGGPFYVMPYMPEGSLSTRLKPAQPAGYSLTYRIAHDVASALAYAHNKGIIHRDIKPANVLLDADGRGYVSDFGLVRSVYNDSITDIRQSQTMGTAAYMSPAVARGEAEDTRCDIYSFGAMLYEMLTGHPPYHGTSSHEIIGKVIAGPPKSITKYNPHASAGLVKIVEGCMARELRDRYARMDDVVADIERVKENKSPFGPHGKIGSNGLVKALFPALAALLILALGGMGLWLKFGRHDAQPATAGRQSGALPAVADNVHRAASALQLAPADSDGAELLRNGTFTEGGILPYSWDIADAKGRLQMSRDSREFFSGPAALRLSTEGESTDGQVFQRIEAPPDGILRISGIGQAHAFHGSVTVVLQTYDNDELVESFEIKNLAGLDKWTPFTADIPLPLKSGATALSIHVSGTGKAWFDDLSVKHIKPGATTMPITVAATRPGEDIVSAPPSELLELDSIKTGSSFQNKWTITWKNELKTGELTYYRSTDVFHSKPASIALMNRNGPAGGIVAHSITVPESGILRVSGYRKIVGNVQGYVGISTILSDGTASQSVPILDSSPAPEWTYFSKDVKLPLAEGFHQVTLHMAGEGKLFVDDLHIVHYPQGVKLPNPVEPASPSDSPATQEISSAPSGSNVSLFNGQDFTGWRGYKWVDPSNSWKIDNRILSAAGDRGVDLVTTESYQDFDLELEWKLAAGGNSGVFYHVTEEYEKAHDSGPEFQLVDNATHIDGNSPLKQAGSSYGLSPALLDATHPAGEWNSLRLIVSAGKAEHWINGKLVCKYDLNSDETKTRIANSTHTNQGRAGKGHVGLQNMEGKAEFRNIRIRRIDASSISATQPAVATPLPLVTHVDADGHRVVELMPLIDPARDAFGSGSWTKKDGELLGSADKAAYSGVDVLYAPPLEYDYRVEFTRTEGDNAISQGLSLPDGVAFCTPGSFGNTIYEFQPTDGHSSDGNTAHTLKNPEGGVMTNGVRYVSTVHARKGKLTADLVGGGRTLVIEADADWAKRGIPAHAGFDPRGLSVGTWGSQVTIHKIELVEITGKGAELKPIETAGLTDLLKNGNFAEGDKTPKYWWEWNKGINWARETAPEHVRTPPASLRVELGMPLTDRFPSVNQYLQLPARGHLLMTGYYRTSPDVKQGDVLLHLYNNGNVDIKQTLVPSTESWKQMRAWFTLPLPSDTGSLGLTLEPRRNSGPIWFADLHVYHIPATTPAAPPDPALMRTSTPFKDSISKLAYRSDGVAVSRTANWGNIREFDPRTGYEQLTSTKGKYSDFSPDGRFTSADGVVRDALGGKEWPIAVSFLSNNSRISPDGRRLVVWPSDQSGGVRRVYDVVTGKMLRELGRATVSNAAPYPFSADGQYFVPGREPKGIVEVFDVETGERKAVQDGAAEGRLYQLGKIFPDGKRVLLTNDDGAGKQSAVIIWDWAKDTKRVLFEHYQYGGVAGFISPDNKWVLTRFGWRHPNLCAVDDETQKPIEFKSGFASGLIAPCDAAFSPDSTRLLLGYYNGVMRLLEIPSGKLLAEFHGEQGAITPIVFSPDGKLAATGHPAEENIIRVWNLPK